VVDRNAAGEFSACEIMNPADHLLEGKIRAQ
jgi:hypothetical protein